MRRGLGEPEWPRGVLARYEVVPEHARVTAADEHPENDVKPAARGAQL